MIVCILYSLLNVQKDDYSFFVLYFTGAFPPCSPMFPRSIFSSLSDTILKSVERNLVWNVGEWETCLSLDSVLSHYVWAGGYRKGLKVDKNHADALLTCKDFDKTKLEPIYKQVPRPIHADSICIQNILGDVKVDEYGSFVNKSSWL